MKNQISLRKMKGIVLILSLMMPFMVFSQTINVKGKITDKKGETVIGASVLVKDVAGYGVSTDLDGNYSLENVPSDGKLEVSYIGMKTQVIEVAGRTVINIQMQEDSEMLDEVVVVGYGTQRKSDLTGSVSQLKADAYENQPVLSTSSALQGRVSGVSISNTSGAPGGQIKIRIRGANSVNNDNAPLIVLDGIAMASLGLQDINPYDIASIDVLKDASATAVYGARGANGVVLVTTKKGKIGQMNVSFKSNFSYNKPINKYDLMNGKEYADYANLLEGGKAYPNGFSGNGTNWQDLMFNTEKWTQNHQLSITGGGDAVRYYISASYQDQPGLLYNTEMKKGGIRSNLDFRITDKLDASVNISLDRSRSQNTGDIGYKGNPVMASIVWDPTSPVYVDGNSEKGYVRNVLSPIWPNPYMGLKEGFGESLKTAIIANAKIGYRITDELKLDITGGVDSYSSRGGSIANDWVSQGNMRASQSYGESYTLQNSNMLTFNKIIDKHNITLTGLYENTLSRSRGFNANGSGLRSLTNGYDNLALNKNQSIDSRYSNWGIVSFMARAAYSYDGKYLLTATVRHDGSSKFQKESRWGTFPSFSLGWNLGKEDFIKDLQIFTNLKLRAGWGKTGNQNIAPYSTLGLLSGGLYSYGTATAQKVYYAGDPQAKDLKWETSVQTNIGLDMSFLDNALNITLDYYNKDTKDLLLYAKVNKYDGGGSQLRNLGRVNNKGFEASISYDFVSENEFTWNSSFNIAYNKNTVKSLGEDDMIFRPRIGGAFMGTEIQVVKVGESLGSFYLIPWEGIYQQDDSKLGYKAGDNKYTDVSGNGSIGFEDRAISGSAMPKITLGFENTFSYKNFDLSILIQGAYGHKIYNATYAAAAVPTSDVKFPTLKEVTNYWTSDNTGSKWANPESKTNKSYLASTQFLQKGDFTRIKNISLAYTLPKEWTKNYGVKLFISGQNLFTFTNYKGFDPENSSTSSNSDADAGIDFGAYPSTKTFTFGISLNFNK